MQLSVKGKQLDVGDALRTHVEDSLSRILDKYFGDAIEVGVTFSKEGTRFRAQVTAHVGRGIQLRAQGDAQEPYPAFDDAAEHLAKRLRRHKRRLRGHHADSVTEGEIQTARQVILADPGGDDIDDTYADADEAPAKSVVIAEMTTEISSLTVEQAVMRMDLADTSALMFRNSAHGGLNMVYRRADGHIGWVDPRGNRVE